MTDGEVFGCQSRATHQWGIAVIKEALYPRRSCCGAGEAPPYFAKTGASVCGGGIEKERGLADSGAQDSVHGETTRQLGAPLERVGEIDGGIFERHGNASSGGISKKREAWLRGRAESRSSYFTTRIDWPR